MALNKKEREQLVALQREAAEARALRWSDYPEEKDVPIPTGSGKTLGWSITTHVGGYQPPHAFESWSSAIHHGTPGLSGGSQDPIRQYSTKLKALWALRRHLERKFARMLADIDAQIAEESLAEVERELRKSIPGGEP